MPSGSSESVPIPLRASSPQAWRRRFRTYLAEASVEQGRMRDLPWQVYAVAKDMGDLARKETCRVEYKASDLVEILATSRTRAEIAICVLAQLGFIRQVRAPRGDGSGTVWELTIPLPGYVQANLPGVWAYLAGKGIKPSSAKRDTAKARQARRGDAVDNPLFDAPDRDCRDSHGDDCRDSHGSDDRDCRDSHASYKALQDEEKLRTTGVPEVTTDVVHIDRELIAELQAAVRELQAQKRVTGHAPVPQRGRHRRPPPIVPPARERPRGGSWDV